MKKCPYCGEEYSDKSQYCLKCGTLLEPIPEPPRNTLLEHIQYGFKIARTRPKVFLPSLGIYVLLFVLVIAFVVSAGIGYSFIEDPSQMVPDVIPNTFIWSFLLLFIIMLYIGLVYEPFTQKVYLDATEDNEIRLWASFRYANSRIVEFLGAYILGLVVAVPILMFWATKLPYDVLMEYDYYGYDLLLQYGWPLLFFIPVGVVYQLGLHIMIWDDAGFFKSIRESIDFIRTSLLKLVGVFVIQFALSLILFRVPFGAIISQAVSIIINLALIDVFQRHKLDTGFEPETAIT